MLPQARRSRWSLPARRVVTWAAAAHAARARRLPPPRAGAAGGLGAPAGGAPRRAQDRHACAGAAPRGCPAALWTHAARVRRVSTAATATWGVHLLVACNGGGRCVGHASSPGVGALRLRYCARICVCDPFSSHTPPAHDLPPPVPPRQLTPAERKQLGELQPAVAALKKQVDTAKAERQQVRTPPPHIRSHHCCMRACTAACMRPAWKPAAAAPAPRASFTHPVSPVPPACATPPAPCRRPPSSTGCRPCSAPTC